GYLIIYIIKKIIKSILKKSSMDVLAKKFIFRTIYVVLYTILAIILIQHIGVPITGLLAGVAAIGVTIGLALQDSLSSLANGIVLIMTKPFKKDDSVTVNGISGKIVAIQFFNTIIDTWDNRRMIIPNKNMVRYEIENTDFHENRRFSINFSVSHNTDIKRLREIITTTLLSNSKIFASPEPLLIVNEISDDRISVEARAWTSSDYCASAELEMKELLFNELKKNKIEIAHNTIVVHTETRSENLQFDPTPLPQRDLSKNQTLNQKEEPVYEDFLDKIVIKNLKKRKAKDSQRKQRKQKKE
ncbi:MAG: mechanosensitive ion channel family protein, partial [Clostridia bacterium]|nr:mechanosensitive ion channel family protein [Clostridia bacterium]